MARRIHAPTRMLMAAIGLAALLHARSVQAEARISGQPEALRVEARDTPVEEVLGALGTNFGLHYRSAASLKRRVTGTYVGSLQRVVAHLLNGYDFVMRTDAGSVEVVVYGLAKPEEAVPGAVVAAPVTPPVVKTARPVSGPAKMSRRERRALRK
jgi:hypothetical protein